MGKCFGCNKKLGFFEGYSSDGVEFCKDCYPKRKEIIKKREREKKKKEKKDQEDYERKVNEEEKEREERIDSKDNKNYVLFLDIFCGISILGMLIWLIPAILKGNFINIPSVKFNILFIGFMVYILFWITMQLVLYFSEYKNWSLWGWSGPILLFGIIFTYIFYFREYRPVLLKNKT